MRRAWYLTALVPLAIGIAIAGTSISRLLDNIESMPRVVVPGEHVLVLNAGHYTVFGELESVVDGTAYRNTNIVVRCGMISEAGKQIPLSQSATKTRYSLGGYTGTSMFEFSLDASTKVLLKCESDQDKAVLAIGSGIGAAIVVAVVAGLIGVLSAIAVIVIVFVKRRRFLRAARAQASKPEASPGSADPA